MPAGRTQPPSQAPRDTARALGGFLLRPAFAFAFVLVLAIAWSALPAWLQTVPHADNIEQLDWAHSLEWGYIKHPPLPTWLLRGAIDVFGPSALLTYALAMGCVALTLLGLWRCGRLILDRRGALLVLLLSSTNYYLMGRGSFLNHNTVMLPFVAVSAWAVLRIGRDETGSAWPLWLLLGLAQGLGLLTKYQMALVVAANLFALVALGAWRRPRFLLHVFLAVLATLVPLVPHLLWLQQHDYSTFGYAGQSLLADLPAWERVRHTLGFALQQVGRFAPAIVAAGLGLWLTRGTAPALALLRACPLDDAESNGVSTAGPSETRSGKQADYSAGNASSAPAPVTLRALAVLALTPIALVIALSLFVGVAPQNHWGASTTLLLPLLVVAAWPALRQSSVPALLAAVLAVHAAAAAWNVVAAQRSPEFHYTFAARPLAAKALAYWQEHTTGQLDIVIGPDWEAGSLSLELPSHPQVLASGERRQAPWVTDERIANCGALVFWRPGQAAQDQIGTDFAQRARDPRLLQAEGPHGKLSVLQVGIIEPGASGC